MADSYNWTLTRIIWRSALMSTQHRLLKVIYCTSLCALCSKCKGNQDFNYSVGICSFYGGWPQTLNYKGNYMILNLSVLSPLLTGVWMVPPLSDLMSHKYFSGSTWASCSYFGSARWINLSSTFVNRTGRIFNSEDLWLMLPGVCPYRWPWRLQNDPSQHCKYRRREGERERERERKWVSEWVSEREEEEEKERQKKGGGGRGRQV